MCHEGEALGPSVRGGSGTGAREEQDGSDGEDGRPRSAHPGIGLFSAIAHGLSPTDKCESSKLKIAGKYGANGDVDGDDQSAINGDYVRARRGGS
ncbi:MAG TPA: hypothetical protein VKD71_04055 [Gemmataceae bacterium]|nr:hypothetical protein [Gemmataceae bacterium]